MMLRGEFGEDTCLAYGANAVANEGDRRGEYALRS